MTSSLDSQIHHFTGSNHQNIVALASAVSTNSWSAVSSLVDCVSELKVTASIANLVNSSQAAMKEFTAWLGAEFPPDALRFLKGGILSGLSGLAIAEAAGLAALFGITVISVKIIAIALLLYGLSIALPAIWKIALGKLEQSTPSFTED